MFDIAAMDIATGSDAGAPMELIDPVRKTVLKDEKGDKVTITLLGINSQVARDTNRRLANATLDKQARGISVGNRIEEAEEEQTEVLTACTVGWSFTELDGKPFPFTPENARKFWADRRFKHIRDQATGFIRDTANFMKG